MMAKNFYPSVDDTLDNINQISKDAYLFIKWTLVKRFATCI